ncbi:unnamed protein product [Dovyalis caffra]|uniref:Uncharacterized protein n=1 Tax=Dovyalis caffra TaxID=77055 RepID=A0AAV1RA84_9ROSI|nr:unnamed protein product [Dovyalis caffra]
MFRSRVQQIDEEEEEEMVALTNVFSSGAITQNTNPKMEGVLPPGSMGWPLIGETLQFIIPGRSLDLHPFVKKRMQKYVIDYMLA